MNESHDDKLTSDLSVDRILNNLSLHRIFHRFLCIIHQTSNQQQSIDIHLKILVLINSFIWIQQNVLVILNNNHILNHPIIPRQIILHISIIIRPFIINSIFIQIQFLPILTHLHTIILCLHRLKETRAMRHHCVKRR